MTVTKRWVGDQWVALGESVAPPAVVEFIEEASNAADSSTSSITVTLASAPQEGDLIVAAQLRNMASGVSELPLDFIHIGAGTHSRWAMGYKVAGPSEGTEYTFPGSANVRAVYINVYRNVDTTNPVVATHFTTSVTSPYTFPSIAAVPGGGVAFGLGARVSGPDPANWWWDGATERTMELISGSQVTSADVLGTTDADVSGVEVNSDTPAGVGAISMRPA